MKLSLSTVNEVFQVISLVFQEILALESQHSEYTHNQTLPTSEPEIPASSEIPKQ